MSGKKGECGQEPKKKTHRPNNVKRGRGKVIKKISTQKDISVREKKIMGKKDKCQPENFKNDGGGKLSREERSKG